MVPVLTYGIKTMMWMEKERSRIRAVTMDNLRGKLGIRRMGLSHECMDQVDVRSDGRCG